MKGQSRQQLFLSYSDSVNDDILSIFCSNPSHKTAVEMMRSLSRAEGLMGIPSKRLSQFTKALLDTILPTLWDKFTSQDCQLLADCLRSVTGLEGIVSRLRALSRLSKQRKGVPLQAVSNNLQNMLAVLQLVIERDTFILDILAALPMNEMNLMGKELVSLLAGSKVLSTAAEAERILSSMMKAPVKQWVGDARLFAIHLGKAIGEATLRLHVDDGKSWDCLAWLLGRSFSLGYTNILVESFTYTVVRPQAHMKDAVVHLQRLIGCMPIHEKRKYTLSLISVASSRHFIYTTPEVNEESTCWWEQDTRLVAGVAALLDNVMYNDMELRYIIFEWFTSSSGAVVGESIALRRFVLAVLSEEFVDKILEKSLLQFGDKLYIKHTPILCQEVNVQTLLLCAGYMSRRMPALLARVTRSSMFLNGISNRLDASSKRARFLGMVVAESISALSHTIMSFNSEEMETPEAKWWKTIVSVDDRMGFLDDLFQTDPNHVIHKPTDSRSHATLALSNTENMPLNQIFNAPKHKNRDCFLSYAIPDSDEETLGDSAAAKDRANPPAPVYVRDLLQYLWKADSYEHQNLALVHISRLIQRKSCSGKEMALHAPELTTALINMHNKFNIINFDGLQLQALVSLVTAEPIIVGHLLVRLFFDGDYGLNQRCTLLSAIGIGARCLAGLSSADGLHLAVHNVQNRVNSLWSYTPYSHGAEDFTEEKSFRSPVHDLTAGIQHIYLKPLAARSGSNTVSLDVLQTRTFSTRMAVAAHKSKPIRRHIKPVIPDALFFPLAGGLSVALHTSTGSAWMHPHIISMSVKTIALVFHAAGPTSNALAQMTTELWELVLVMVRRNDEYSVREACLFALFNLLEVNLESATGGRWLVDTGRRMLVETQDWVEFVLQDAEDLHALAAGVLVEIQKLHDRFPIFS